MYVEETVNVIDPKKKSPNKVKQGQLNLFHPNKKLEFAYQADAEQAARTGSPNTRFSEGM